MNVKKSTVVFFLLMIMFLLTNSFAADNVPVVNSYEEYKTFVSETILSQKTSMIVEITNYNQDTYEFDKVLKDLQSSTPEIAYIFLRADNGSISGYADSSKKTLKFDLYYKNKIQSLENMYIAKNQEELKVIINKNFQNFETSAFLKIIDYSEQKYPLGQIVELVLGETPGFKTGYNGLSTTTYGNGTNKIVSVKFNFVYDIEKIKQFRQLADTKAKEIIASIIKPEMPDYQKEALIHDYIVNNTAYDHKNLVNKTVPSESYSVYGVLVKNQAVCEGYAGAFKTLLNLAGIECMIVTGSGKQELHAWNIVKIQGNYYNVDVTWDDPVTDNGDQILKHEYFNVTDELLRKDHQWDESKYPKCVTTSYNYDNTLAAIKNVSVSEVKKETTVTPGKEITTQTQINLNNSVENSVYTNTTLPANFNYKIKLTIGSNILTINDLSKEIDPGRMVAPIIVEGRTIVPIRVIAEALKGVVKWDEKTNTVIIVKDGIELKLKTGSNTVSVNGVEKQITVPATIVNGRTFVPIRFISENLGAQVEWDEKLKEVTIYAKISD